MLGLPWPWCALELLRVFYRGFVATDEPDWTGFAGFDHYLSDDEEWDARPQAPPLMLGFATEYGEVVGEARERLTALYTAAVAELDAAEKRMAGGVSPKGGGAHLRRYAEWFYET